MTTHRIKEVREQTRDASGRKLSGITIARQLGITPQYYYDIEKGERNLSAELASKIADILNVSVDYLLRKTDNPSTVNDAGIAFDDEDNMNMQILTALRPLTDDEGYFFEDLREEVFEAIDQSGLYMAYAYHNASDHEAYLNQFREYFRSAGDYSERQTREIVDDFNKAYNYRTLKVAISSEKSFETKESFLTLINRILDEHKIKTPDPFENEREFQKRLDLSDEELLQRFTPELDGEKLSREEFLEMIAFLRVKRQMKK